jgi:hypothetical protein
MLWRAHAHGHSVSPIDTYDQLFSLDCFLKGDHLDPEDEEACEGLSLCLNIKHKHKKFSKCFEKNTKNVKKNFKDFFILINFNAEVRDSVNFV